MRRDASEDFHRKLAEGNLAAFVGAAEIPH
jgi:hypothetical protein